MAPAPSSRRYLLGEAVLDQLRLQHVQPLFVSLHTTHTSSGNAARPPQGNESSARAGACARGLTIEEGLRPDEAGVPHGRAQEGPLQERPVAPVRARRPQEHHQAQDGQALDKGADPGRLVFRDPEEEVDGTGEEERAQPPAQVQLLWGTRESLSPTRAGARVWGLSTLSPPPPRTQPHCCGGCSGTGTSHLTDPSLPERARTPQFLHAAQVPWCPGQTPSHTRHLSLGLRSKAFGTDPLPRRPCRPMTPQTGAYVGTGGFGGGGDSVWLHVYPRSVLWTLGLITGLREMLPPPWGWPHLAPPIRCRSGPRGPSSPTAPCPHPLDLPSAHPPTWLLPTPGPSVVVKCPSHPPPAQPVRKHRAGFQHPPLCPGLPAPQQGSRAPSPRLGRQDHLAWKLPLHLPTRCPPKDCLGVPPVLWPPCHTWSSAPAQDPEALPVPWTAPTPASLHPPEGANASVGLGKVITAELVCSFGSHRNKGSCAHQRVHLACPSLLVQKA